MISIIVSVIFAMAALFIDNFSVSNRQTSTEHVLSRFFGRYMAIGSF
jgi:hypothetical protein